MTTDEILNEAEGLDSNLKRCSTILSRQLHGRTKIEHKVHLTHALAQVSNSRIRVLEFIKSLTDKSEIEDRIEDPQKGRCDVTR
jgi:hypothetical protein